MISETQPTAVRQSDTATHTHLSGSRLTIARLVWFVLVGASLAVLALSAVRRYQSVVADAEGYAGALAELGMGHPAYAIFRLSLHVIHMSLFLVPALLIFLRRSDDWMAMLTSAMLVMFGGFVANDLVYTLLDEGGLLGLIGLIMLWLSQSVFMWFLYVVPDGKFVPRWTRLATILWVVILAGIYFTPNFMLNAGPGRQWLNTIGFVIVLIAYASTLANQLYRMRRYYTLAQKQQMKWILTGLMAALLGGYIFSYFPILFYPELGETGVPGLIFQIVRGVVLTLSVGAVPAAITFSILRYRLWDVDFLINRSLVYTGLTALLAVLFVIALLLSQVIFRALHGDMQSGIALTVSALIFGAAFAPARRRLQAFIDWRFYGIRVDYQRRGGKPAPSAGALLTTLGSYQNLEFVGRGGMAEVYRAKHPTLNRAVAIKVLPASLAHEVDFRRRFEREAQVVAALKHPNIVQMFDFGEADGTYYMVMEYLDGESLADRLRSGGALTVPQTREVIDEVAGALDYAHAQGLVHRDIKPSNVMLERVTTTTRGKTQRAVLMDFGIARMSTGGTQITHTGVVGTFDYIAPEQIKDAHDVDARADIYALGVVAFQMLTGQLPFHSNNPGALLIAHMNQPAPDPCSIRADIPEGTAEAVLRALEKDPARRWPSAGQFATALG